MENTYPVESKNVVINSNEYTLTELPVRYIIGVEKGQIEESLISTCEAGSNTPIEVILDMSKNQLSAMFSDIMVLSYGEGWDTPNKEQDVAKKK